MESTNEITIIHKFTSSGSITNTWIDSVLYKRILKIAAKTKFKEDDIMEWINANPSPLEDLEFLMEGFKKAKIKNPNEIKIFKSSI